MTFKNEDTYFSKSYHKNNVISEENSKFTAFLTTKEGVEAISYELYELEKLNVNKLLCEQFETQKISSSTVVSNISLSTFLSHCIIICYTIIKHIFDYFSRIFSSKIKNNENDNKFLLQDEPIFNIRVNVEAFINFLKQIKSNFF